MSFAGAIGVVSVRCPSLPEPPPGRGRRLLSGHASRATGGLHRLVTVRRRWAKTASGTPNRCSSGLPGRGTGQRSIEPHCFAVVRPWLWSDQHHHAPGTHPEPPAQSSLAPDSASQLRPETGGPSPACYHPTDRRLRLRRSPDVSSSSPGSPRNLKRRHKISHLNYAPDR